SAIHHNLPNGKWTVGRRLRDLVAVEIESERVRTGARERGGSIGEIKHIPCRRFQVAGPLACSRKSDDLHVNAEHIELAEPSRVYSCSSVLARGVRRATVK